MPQNNCANCGAQFAARRSTAAYCSAPCRVKNNRASLRETVLRNQGGRCIVALQADYADLPEVESDGFVEVKMEVDHSPCHGALVIIGRAPRTPANCAAICLRHKGRRGEERLRERLGDEWYLNMRRQQGRECAGNAHFRDNVGGFNRGYRNPEKLGPKSSWKEPFVNERDDLEKYVAEVWGHGT